MEYKFSVLISVYKNENHKYFSLALDSLLDQTLLPDEVVIVIDGPVSELIKGVIEQFADKYECTNIIELNENVGLSNALKIGLDHCKYDIVARMDSDDFSVKERFEIQIEHLKNNPGISLVGSSYAQYDSELIKYQGSRKLPFSTNELKNFSRTRTPINHVTIMFKKADAIKSGGYPKMRWPFEDWWFANRLLTNNYRINNLENDLVLVRGGDDFLVRRRGFRYAFIEIRNLIKMANEDLIKWYDVVINILIRTPTRLVPLIITKMIYSKLINKR